MCRSFIPLAVAAALLGCAVSAHAQDPLSGCTKAKSSKFDDYTPVREPDPSHPDRIRYVLTGDVAIVCNDMRLFADRIEWTNDGDWAYLSGHVFLQQLNMRISAASGTVNRKTHLGTFDQVSGTIEMNEKKQSDQFGGLEPDAIFSGTQLEKIGLRTYRLSDGDITTCTQPTPRWEMDSSKATITPGDRVVMHNMVLKLKDVPLFYLPVIYYPISKEGRSTGILMPSYGSSTVGGFQLHNGFFWAIDRSQDATFYEDYFSKAGQGFSTQYRYVESPTSNGNMQFSVLDQKAQFASDGTTVLTPAEQTYRLIGFGSQTLPAHFTLIGNANYFSSAESQQTYQQNLADFSQRTSSLSAVLSGTNGPYLTRITFDQSDLYTGGAPAQRSGHEPLMEFSIAQKPIGHSKVYFGLTSQAGDLVRINNVDDPTTDHSLWREDLQPTVQVSLSNLPYLSFTTSGSWEFTAWSAQQDPTSPTLAAVGRPIYRQLFDFKATVDGPSFERIFTVDDGYAEKLKHKIEPLVTLEWKSPFANLNQIVLNDGIDSDVGGTTNVTYGVTNHILASRKVAGGQTASSEILTVKVNQTYTSNAFAAAYDPNYQSTITGFVSTAPPSNFTPIAMSVTSAMTTNTSGQFSLDYDAHFREVRDYSATGRLKGSAYQLDVSWLKQNVIPELAAIGQGYTVPQHFINSTFSYKPPDHHVGASYQINYDIQNSLLVNQRVLVFYNSQCCGVTFDYQSLGALPGLPADHRFGFSFSLAGLGSFSNPFGSFGG